MLSCMHSCNSNLSHTIRSKTATNNQIKLNDEMWNDCQTKRNDPYYSNPPRKNVYSTLDMKANECEKKTNRNNNKAID